MAKVGIGYIRILLVSFLSFVHTDILLWFALYRTKKDASKGQEPKKDYLKHLVR